MSTRTILLTNALRKRQTLKARINKAIQELLILGVVVKDKGKPVSTSLPSTAAQEEYIKSSYQSLCDLQKEYYKLIEGITQANASNKITIAGEDVSLAVAIEMRNSYASFLNSTVQIMARTIKNTEVHLVKNKEKIEDQIDVEVRRSASQEDTAEQTLELAAQIRERVTTRLEEVEQDPLNARQLLLQTSGKLEDVRDELETKLNIANATISFEY